MPRKKKAAEQQPTGAAGNGTETVAGYFRRIFAENPKLLKSRSNEPLYERWLADHPEHSEVPQHVKTGLQNIKSVLRREKGKKPPRVKEAAEVAPAAPAKAKLPKGSLERLELLIDDCLWQARGLGDEELAGVISHLRQARNAVIRRSGAGEE
jgi:hypothetical protein